MVARCFEAVLGVSRVGARDNFFSLGGDSRTGARVVSRLNATFAIRLPVSALFLHPCAAALATAIEAARQAASDEEARLAAGIDALSDDEGERLLAAAETRVA